jgi:hypothetical protein
VLTIDVVVVSEFSRTELTCLDVGGLGASWRDIERKSRDNGDNTDRQKAAQHLSR